MVAAIGSTSWIEWVVDATPGGSQVSALIGWLLEPRRVGRWTVVPAVAMACALAGCYAAIGGLVLVGVTVPWEDVQPTIAGCIVVGVVVMAYATRNRD
jgi:hypothetical protein